MPREYTVEDELGREITFEWDLDTEPTDADFEEIFAASADFTPEPATLPSPEAPEPALPSPEAPESISPLDTAEQLKQFPPGGQAPSLPAPEVPQLQPQGPTRAPTQQEAVQQQQAFEQRQLEAGPQIHPVESVFYGAGKGLTFGLLAPTAEGQTAQKQNPKAFALGQMVAAISQSVGGGNIVAQGLKSIPALKNSTLLLNTLTRMTTSGIISGANNAGEVIHNEKAMKEAIWDTVQAIGGSAISVLPELQGTNDIVIKNIKIPWQAVQILGQPGVDLAYEAIVDSARGRDVGSEEWWINQAINLGVSTGFAIKDVASGQEFKVTSEAMQKDAKAGMDRLFRIIKRFGKNPDDIEITKLKAAPDAPEITPEEVPAVKPKKSKDVKPEVPGKGLVSWEDFQKLSPAEQQTVFEANPSTGKPGLPAFNRVFKNRTNKYSEPVVVAAGDINGFKVLNDKILGVGGTDRYNARLYDAISKHLPEESLFNIHGDEYMAFGASVEELQTALKAAMEDIAKIPAVGKLDNEFKDKEFFPTMTWSIARSADPEEIGDIDMKRVGKNKIGIDKTVGKDYTTIVGTEKVSEKDILRREKFKDEADIPRKLPEEPKTRPGLQEKRPGKEIPTTKPPEEVKKPRQFIETLKKEEPTKEVGEAVGKRLYEPVSHKETEKLASDVVKEKGLEGSIRWLQDEDRPSSTHTNVALKVISDLQSKAGKAKTPAESDAFMQRAVEIAESTAERLTKMGQEIEAVKTIANLDPDAVILTTQRRINQHNKKKPSKKPVKITVTESGELRELAKDAKRLDILSETAKKTAEFVQNVLQKDRLSPDDIKLLKDYSWQLGSVLREPSKKLGKPGKRKSSIVLTQEFFRDRGDAALNRFNERHGKGPILHAGLPFEDMKDLSEYGAFRIAEGATKFGDWALQMSKQFGKPIHPHLRKIWNRSQDLFQSERRRVSKLHKESNLITKILKDAEADARVSPVQAETLRNAADNIEKLSGDMRTEAVLELQQTMNRIVKKNDPKLLAKISSVQTMAQLLNVKTIGRNLIGNELFYRLERLNSYVASPVDIVTAKITGERSRTFKTGGQKGYWDGLIKGSRLALKGLQPGDVVTKFDLKGPAFSDAKGPISNVLKYLEKIMSVTLQGTDYAAYNRAKNQALGELGEVEAINLKLTGDEKKKFVQDFVKTANASAIETASKYGKYATFQDENIFSKTAVGLKRLMNARQDFGVGDLVLKYPKTPSNLFARAIDYSPAGFVRGAYELTKATRGDFNQREFVNALSRAITGTAGMTMLGYLFLNNGVITGSPQDRRVRELEREFTGEGPYKVNATAIGRWARSGFKEDSLKKKAGDLLISYDWAQPIAINIAASANVAQAMNETAVVKGRVATAFDGFAASFAGGAQALAEQPLLTGLQTLFGANASSNLSEGERWLNSALRIAEEAPASFVPTFFYQLRQLKDNTVREKRDPNPAKRAFNRVINKLPFFSESLPEMYKLVGASKRDVFEGGSNTLFNVLLNPAFVTKYKVDPIIEMALNPFEQQFRTRQLPKFAPRKLSYGESSFKDIANIDIRDKKQLEEHGLTFEKDRVSFELTGEELSELQKFMSTLVEKQFERALPLVKGMTPKEQEAFLGKEIGKVSSVARRQFLQKKVGIISDFSFTSAEEVKSLDKKSKTWKHNFGILSVYTEASPEERKKINLKTVKEARKDFFEQPESFKRRKKRISKELEGKKITSAEARKKFDKLNREILEYQRARSKLRK